MSLPFGGSCQERAKAKVSSRCISARTRTRPAYCASGTCPRPTSSKRGATSAGTTAPLRSSNRSSLRSTTGSRSLSSSLTAVTAPAAANPAKGYDIVRAYWKKTDDVQKMFPGFKKADTFEIFWQETVRAGVVAGHRPRKPENVALAGNWAAERPGPDAGPRCREYRTQFPDGSGALRWPLRQQRLAPRAAQADHQADLGQCRDHEPGDGDEAWDRQDGLSLDGGRTRSRRSRHPGTGSSRQEGESARMDPSRTRRQRRHHSPGLRPRTGRARSTRPPTSRTPKASPFAASTPTLFALSDGQWFATGLTVTKTRTRRTILACTQGRLGR